VAVEKIRIPNFINNAVMNLLSIASDDEMRPNIYGINIDLKRKIGEASDGNAYIKIDLMGIENNLKGVFLLPREFIEAIKGFKLSPYNLAKAQIELDKKYATFIFESLKFTSAINLGEFPNVERHVFGEIKNDRIGQIRLNPNLLMRCKKALTIGEKTGVKLDLAGINDPIIIRNDCNRIVGAIMPMNI